MRPEFFRRRVDACATLGCLFGAGFLIQWGNRYYISQAFDSAASAATLDEARYSYELLTSAHSALVGAVASVPHRMLEGW